MATENAAAQRKDSGEVFGVEALDEGSGIRVRLVGEELRVLLPAREALYVLPVNVIRLAHRLLVEADHANRAEEMRE